MEIFLSWLFSSAGAGWIFGVLTLVALLITRNKDFKPSRIVVKEERRIEPITVKKSIKDKISISFDGREVENLGQLFIDIYNEGNKSITNPKISIQLPSDIKILSCEFVGSNLGSIEIDENIATVSFDYLNPYSEHKHIELLSFVTDGIADNISAQGSGDGWSIRHVALPTVKQGRRDTKIFFIGLVALFIALIAYTFWLDIYHGIPRNEISVRAFIAFLPGAVPLVAWVIFWYNRLSNIANKSFKL